MDLTKCALTARAVDIRFQRKDEPSIDIVQNLHLKVPAGSLVCIVGRSGSGKTSILRAMGGLAKPTRGDIAWWGLDLLSLSEDQISQYRRRHIGYVDQGSSLIADLSSIENVLVPVLPDGRSSVNRARQLGSELLNELGLGNRIHERPATLSGGERQRVALARSLVNDPSLLIVDEPTASLDRLWADRVIRMLTRQQEQGTAVLVASHDLSVAAAATSKIELEPSSP